MRWRSIERKRSKAVRPKSWDNLEWKFDEQDYNRRNDESTLIGESREDGVAAQDYGAQQHVHFVDLGLAKEERRVGCH